jgi:hypothetical protein
MKFKIDKKLLYEFISITFAVFLGLMLNQWKDNHNNNKIAKQSKSNILTEIADNKTTVQDMLKEHKLSLAKIDSILPLIDDSNKHEDFYIGTNFQIISSTSWETAKLTQAIAYIDIDIVTDIAGIYDFQHYYESIVKDFVINNIYNKPEKRDKEFIKKMKTFLEAIIPMENNLVEYYNYAQTEILNE